MQGYIKLFRKFTEWEWYNNINVKVLFIHLLLNANHKEKQWQGIKIDKGQILTSLEHLSREIGLTVQQTRTALTKLKSTCEITSKSTNQYTLITLVNWRKYQLDKEKITNEITSDVTNEQQTDNKRITTNNNDKNEKNDNNIKEIYKEKYFDDDELNDLFIDFLKLRKKLKAINNEVAIKKLINKLNNYDDNIKKQMIENSIVNSWKGVFEIKETKKYGRQQTADDIGRMFEDWSNEDEEE